MKDYSLVLELLKKHLPDLQMVYIFGSSGTPFENQESDLDIAVLTPTRLDNVFRFNLSQEIARKISRDVDLIDLQQASTVLRFQIVSTGKRIYCRDKNFCALFETLVYSMYIRFNDERKEIVDQIRNRGQIYRG